jgi:hypothetical protein
MKYGLLYSNPEYVIYCYIDGKNIRWMNTWINNMEPVLFDNKAAAMKYAGKLGFKVSVIEIEDLRLLMAERKLRNIGCSSSSVSSSYSSSTSSISI